MTEAPPSSAAPSTLCAADGARIAYHRTPATAAPERPGIVFLGGFMSDMTGTKATALEGYARERGRAFLRFDYQGHGQSSGRFEDGTIGSWAQDALAAFDALTEGPQILVGSSMGGWIALLLARARPGRVAGLVGIAAAPDFTERMWAGFDAETRAALERDGAVSLPSDYDETPYTITRALIEDGRAQCLLDRPLALDAPVRLLQGTADEAVPWRDALAIMERLESQDVEVILVKDGDHRLSEPRDLARLFAVLDQMP